MARPIDDYLRELRSYLSGRIPDSKLKEIEQEAAEHLTSLKEDVILDLEGAELTAIQKFGPAKRFAHNILQTTEGRLSVWRASFWPLSVVLLGYAAMHSTDRFDLIIGGRYFANGSTLALVAVLVLFFIACLLTRQLVIGPIACCSLFLGLLSFATYRNSLLIGFSSPIDKEYVHQAILNSSIQLSRDRDALESVQKGRELFLRSGRPLPQMRHYVYEKAFLTPAWFLTRGVPFASHPGGTGFYPRLSEYRRPQAAQIRSDYGSARAAWAANGWQASQTLRSTVELDQRSLDNLISSTRMPNSLRISRIVKELCLPSTIATFVLLGGVNVAAWLIALVTRRLFWPRKAYAEEETA